MGRRRRRSNEPVVAGRDLATATWNVVRRCAPPELIRVEQLSAHWEEIVTRRLAPHIWPAGFDGDELILRVTDSNWLHELTYLQGDLLRRIRMHDPKVARLRLRVATEDLDVRGKTRAALREETRIKAQTRPAMDEAEREGRAHLAEAVEQMLATVPAPPSPEDARDPATPADTGPTSVKHPRGSR